MDEYIAVNDDEFFKKHVCRECGANYSEGKYCTSCGARVIEPEEKVIDYRTIPVVYGPPPDLAEIECDVCHSTWSTYRSWGDKKSKKTFCPNCGKCFTVRDFKSFF